jgi:hypothetical protein
VCISALDALPGPRSAVVKQAPSSAIPRFHPPIPPFLVISIPVVVAAIHTPPTHPSAPHANANNAQNGESDPATPRAPTHSLLGRRRRPPAVACSTTESAARRRRRHKQAHPARLPAFPRFALDAAAVLHDAQRAFLFSSESLNLLSPRLPLPHCTATLHTTTTAAPSLSSLRNQNSHG